jgi:hypothetical protein
MKILFTLTYFILSICWPTLAGKTEDGRIFEEQEPIRLTLITDVVALQNDKSEEPDYIEGLLIHRISTYQLKSFEMKVKARGTTRRLTELCDFPPLKFDLKKNKVANTIFDGQNKLKFVAQCRRNEQFENYLFQEYLIYKSFNLLTPNSYRVRLVELEIKDQKLRLEPISMYGFLIEDDEGLADRIDAQPYELPVYSQDSCQAFAVDVLATFQYMIGNTDWYINTRHNIDIFETSNGEMIPVPFDFDFSGLINMPYAQPSNEIPIKRVTQRYYKGSCRQNFDIENVIALFSEQKKGIFALYSNSGYLDPLTARKSLRYFKQFYKQIEDPERAKAIYGTACQSSMGLNSKLSR